MKYFLTIVLLSVLVVRPCFAQKSFFKNFGHLKKETENSNQSAWQDSIMQVHFLANSNYKGLLSVPIPEAEEAERITVTPILGSGSATISKSFEYGAVLELNYFKSHKDSKKKVKEVTELFKNLIKSKQYKFKVAYTGSQILTEGGRSIIQYSIEEDRDPVLVLKFFQTPNILSEETAYQGRFPFLPAKTKSPQIYQLKGLGLTADSYERYNGIIQGSELVKGMKTFHGYGVYRDGKWYSDDWRTTGKRSNRAFVYFVPENTADTIFGVFNEVANMAQFYPDRAYGAKFKHGILDLYDDAPAWLKTTYLSVEAKRADEQEQEQLKYNREHPRMQTADPIPGKSKAGGEGISWKMSCSVCNGTGRVGHNETQTQFRSGGKDILINRMVWERCSACNGSGHK